jgi:hypothetical protein
MAGSRREENVSSRESPPHPRAIESTRGFDAVGELGLGSPMPGITAKLQGKLQSWIAAAGAPSAQDSLAVESGARKRRREATASNLTVLSHVTEGSILHRQNVGEFVPFAVAGRMRRATCSGVAWFRGYHLAVVNLYGGHLRLYRFHPGQSAELPARLELLHEVGDGIEFPEDVAVSADGTRLAIGHALSKRCGVTLFAIDQQSLAPIRRETIRAGDGFLAFHGVTFSPDSRHLVMCEITNPGYVEVVRVSSPSRECTSLVPNRLAPLKPKSTAISHDGRFAAIAMGLNGTPNRGSLPCGGRVLVHRFDAANGILSAEPIAEFKPPDLALAALDLCTFAPTAPYEPYRVLVVDQGTDAVYSFHFDPENRTIERSGVFADHLSFPHGVDVSADGRFVAFSNYGDDSVRIDRLAPS